MIKIICEDGAKFEGKDVKEVVNAMRLDMWDPVPETNEDYMAGVAKRAKIYDGKGISYSDEEEFLNELVRVGVIEKMEITG